MPNRFNPINSRQGLQQSLRQINSNFMMLDAEAYSKTISGGGSKQMVTGRLPNGRYGELFYDTSGRARILIGQAPSNARPGIWITKDGFDVLQEVK